MARASVMLLLLLGCRGAGDGRADGAAQPDAPATAADAGERDRGAPEADATAALRPDAGIRDVAAADTGVRDTLTTDAGAPDAAAGDVAALAGPAMLEIIAVLSGERPIDAAGRLADRATAAAKRRARAYLAGAFRSIGLATREQSFVGQAGAGVNLYAELSSPVASNELVIFGAHYDTVPGAPGANDNASGAAAVYAVARWLVTVPAPKRSAVFAFFDGHETGGLEGSKAFAAMIVDRGARVHSVHTIDQIAWDGDDDRGIELEQPTQALQILYRTAAEDLDVPVMITREISDHASFRARQMPAVGITEQYRQGDTTPHRHTPRDGYATVDVPYFESTLRLVLAAVRPLF